MPIYYLIFIYNIFNNFIYSYFYFELFKFPNFIKIKTNNIVIFGKVYFKK